ncbi:MAG: hypothetical protein IPK12_20275 [Gemmatimonadetes bacterium]|nr:hypothetical protein [Gemmatimonadota bacterium]
MGGAIKFIPYPVTTGFTTGIALIIFSSQVRDFLGLRMDGVPAEFLEKWAAYGAAIGTVNWAATGVALLALGIITQWPRLKSRVPGPFVALVACTALVKLAGLPVETIGDRFGPISASLPVPHLPPLSLALVRDLSGAAFTIALLAGIESLLSAVVADGMIGTRHRSNMELVAWGVSTPTGDHSSGPPRHGPSRGPPPKSRTADAPGGRKGCSTRWCSIAIMLLVGKGRDGPDDVRQRCILAVMVS